MTTSSADNNKDADQVRGQSAHADSSISGPDDLMDKLLPGISNDIVLQVIAPKLSGTDFNTLSLVSRTWREAIRIYGRWVYDARVKSPLTENFVVVIHTKREEHKHQKEEYKHKLCLYPLKGNCAYDVPPIPFHDFSYIRRYKCIALDGKIYIWGGAITGSSPFLGSCCGSRMMFMLDVAGHKSWKQCASMQEGRQDVCAGVLDGKIYVVGGVHNGNPVDKCEVYDPKLDAWSSIPELVPLGYNYRVGAIGGELVVYDGLEWRENLWNLPLSDCVAVYNPVRNEWRQLGHDHGGLFQFPRLPEAFIAQRKFHTFTEDGIDVYDMDRDSWTNLHSFGKKMGLSAIWTFALDDEIVTYKYSIYYTYDKRYEPIPQVPLFQSRGFGKNTEIAFEPLGNSRLISDLDPMNGLGFIQMCFIQL